MAFKMSEKYGSQATTPDANYPGGTFKNNTGLPNTGTPLEHEWARDKDGFFQKTLYDADMVPTGSTDTAATSQYFNALKYQFARTPRRPGWGMQDICAAVYGEYDSTARPDCYPNLYDIAAVLPAWVLRDSCVGVSKTTQLPIIYMLINNDEVYPVAGPLIYDAIPVIGSALDLEYSSATMESVRSVCSDGDNLYVLWRSTDSEYWVTKFYMMHPSSDAVVQWNKNLLTDFSVDEEYSKIIVASSSYLAVSLDNVSGSTGVAILTKSSGALVKGSGSSIASPEAPSNGRIVSDGDHVFWLVRITNGMNFESYICSAKISNPSTSDYTSQIIGPSYPDPLHIPSAIFNYGKSPGNVICSTPSGLVYAFIKGSDEVKYCLTLENHPCYEGTADYGIVAGCDGLNMWLQLHQEDDAYSTARLSFAKFPLTLFTKSNMHTTTYNYTASVVLTKEDGRIITGDEPGRLLFDGVDMWYFARAGYICRITNPGMR